VDSRLCGNDEWCVQTLLVRTDGVEDAANERQPCSLIGSGGAHAEDEPAAQSVQCLVWQRAEHLSGNTVVYGRELGGQRCQPL